MLPPPAQEMQQSADPAESPRPLGAGEPPSVPGRPRVSLVVFLGGITYGELGALRKLSELEDGRRRFLVLTTELLSTRRFFDALKCEQAVAQPLSDQKKGKPAADAKKGGGFSFLPGFR
mmetsp:Transcript_58285/g.161256  ORF Transcript_58285/g.161256 Transcript_58285/m.161256 type:complete len:119 (+) Transcript_58285:3-359(+)